MAGNASNHLANERTYLAWVRTSIGIMAFGFVVVKFSLFIKQIGLALGRQAIVLQKGYSAIIGILLVAVGAVVLLFSFLQYRRTRQQLNEGRYQASSLLSALLTAFILLISICLIVYLINSV